MERVSLFINTDNPETILTAEETPIIIFYSLLGDPSANRSDSPSYEKMEMDNRDLSFIMAGVRSVIRSSRVAG